MSKPDRPSESFPDQAPPEKPGQLDEARDLFGRMASEAVLQSHVAQNKAKSRGLVTRTLLMLTIAASLLAAATMVYGIYYFPDAPIRQTDGGYVSKVGRPSTQEEFDAFLRWEKAMFLFFPSVFVFGIAFGITDRVQRRQDVA